MVICSICGDGFLLKDIEMEFSNGCEHHFHNSCILPYWESETAKQQGKVKCPSCNTGFDSVRVYNPDRPMEPAPSFEVIPVSDDEEDADFLAAIKESMLDSGKLRQEEGVEEIGGQADIEEKGQGNNNGAVGDWIELDIEVEDEAIAQDMQEKEDIGQNVDEDEEIGQDVIEEEEIGLEVGAVPDANPLPLVGPAVFVPNPPNPLQCGTCGRVLRSRASKSQHKKTHDVPGFRCNAAGCKKSFARAYTLKRHQDRFH